MIGNLAQDEIERILQKQSFGHLGFTDGKEMFVLPFFYTYDAGALLLHSYEGQKMDALRAHPRVAFQVEEIEHPHAWNSVLLHGTFEEISTEDAVTVIEKIVRPMEEISSRQPYSPLFLQGDAHSYRNDGTPPIFFRIRIEVADGRCERMTE